MAAEQTAQFGVQLADGVSGSAEAAAGALRKLKQSIDADKAALSQMQSAMRALQSSSTVNVAQFRELQARIEAQKTKIAEATGKYVELGGTFEKVGKKGKSAFEKMLEGARGAPGPLGAIASQLSQVSGMLPAVAAAAGLFAVTAGVVALAAATTTATAALLRYGLAQAEARRNELGRLEGLTLMRTRFRVAAGSATDLQRAIDSVSGSSSQGRGELEEMTERLYRMGLRGQALERALEGAAMSTDVLGERGQQRFLALAAHARRTGGSIDALAERIQGRLGPAAARRALSWDSQVARLQRNIGQIFGGLKIDGLLASVKPIFDIFSQSQASGRALKLLFETIFQPFVNQAERGGPLIENTILRLIIGSQRLTIFVNDMRIVWLRAFGTPAQAPVEQLTGKMRALHAATLPLRAVLLPVVTLLERARGGGNLAARSDTTGQLTASMRAASSRAGAAVNEGLIHGVRGGSGAFPEAMRELGRRGMAAFREELGIRSPSRAFARLGIEIPRGVAVGVERGGPEVDRAIEHMVRVPSTPSFDAVTAASPAAVDRAGAGSLALTIGEIHVHVGADDAPRMTARAIIDELVRELEGAAITLGVPTPAPGGAG